MAKTLPNQNRDAPAFMEYAAAMMAKREYRQLSLAERGLLYTLRLECWVNRSMPSDAGRLARMLGCDKAEIEMLMPAMRPFFEILGDDLRCPELEDYRKYRDARRDAMAEGGRKSAEKRKAKAIEAGQAPSKHPASTLQALRQDQTSQNQSKPVRHGETSTQAWVDDYSAACTSDEYAKAKGG